MANQSGGARRFSLVLLDADEYLLESVQTEVTMGAALLERLSWDLQRNAGSSTSAHMLPDATVSGRLWIASHSLFFEPKLNKYAIVRLLFDRMPHCPTALMQDESETNSSFCCAATRLTEMKAYDQNYPYLLVNLPNTKTGAESGSALDGSKWNFKLQTSAVLSSTLALIQDLWAYSQDIRRRDIAIQAQVVEPRMATKFDRSRLVDFRERVMMEQDAVVNRVSPLVHVPGRVLVTDRRVYFQPVALNNIGEACSHFEIGDVVAIYKRRYLLRDSALELTIATPHAMDPRSRRHSPSPYDSSARGRGGGERRSSTGETYDSSQDNDGQPSATGTRVLFAVESGDTAMRDMIYNAIVDSRKAGSAGKGTLSSRNPITEASALQRVQESWVNGKIGNYAYLVFLNDLAHRSMNDLTQYPVFPWVLADYTSHQLDLTKASTFRDLTKPMGALNPERLKSFQERFATMTEDMKPFLYGTHYSTPGYVLFYLVRQAPDLMLRLQNGRFDEPDRLFVSIAETWNNVTHNPADLKELIPEFYDTKGIDYNDSAASTSRQGTSSSDGIGESELAGGGGSLSESPGVGNFLVNHQHVDLGRRQDGVLVDDVILPPWATSASDFVRKNRQALECEYVSERLHHWVDLVFGYKQRGDEALKADNLFYHMTYEGSVDFEAIKHDTDQLKATETQIYEFGQTPKQLFFAPHPKRRATTHATQATSDVDVLPTDHSSEQVNGGHESDSDDPEWADASQVFESDSEWQHDRHTSPSHDSPFDPLQPLQPFGHGTTSDDRKHVYEARHELSGDAFGLRHETSSQVELVWADNVSHTKDSLSSHTPSIPRSLLLHSGALIGAEAMSSAVAGVDRQVFVAVAADSFLSVIDANDLSVIRKVSVTGTPRTKLTHCCAVRVEDGAEVMIVLDALGDMYGYNTSSGMLARVKPSDAYSDGERYIGVVTCDMIGCVVTLSISGRVVLWKAHCAPSAFGGLVLDEPRELTGVQERRIVAPQTQAVKDVAPVLVWQGNGKALAVFYPEESRIVVIQLPEESNRRNTVPNDGNAASSDGGSRAVVIELGVEMSGAFPKCVAWIPDDTDRLLVCGNAEDGVRIVDVAKGVSSRLQPPVGVWEGDGRWEASACHYVSESTALIGDHSGALWQVNLEHKTVSLLARVRCDKNTTATGVAALASGCANRPNEVIVCCDDGSLGLALST